jgi:hypothetical protein
VAWCSIQVSSKFVDWRKHYYTSQQAVIFNVTTMRTSNSHISDHCCRDQICITALKYIGGQNNGNIKKLRNKMFVGYTERTSVGNSEWSSSVCLHFVALVSVHLWLYWATVRVIESKNRRLVRFLKRTNRRCAFSWRICHKITTRLLVYPERQFLRLCRHT